MIKTILIAFALFATTANAEYWEEPVDYTKFTEGVTTTTQSNAMNDEFVKTCQDKLNAYYESVGYFDKGDYK